MLVESLSVKKSILEMIRCINSEEGYLGKCLEAFIAMQAEHQSALVSYFYEEIGNEAWSEFTEDETLYLEFMKAVMAFYSGREHISKEPDRFQLIEMLEGYLESKRCHSIEDEKGKKKFEKLMEEVGTCS